MGCEAAGFRRVPRSNRMSRSGDLAENRDAYFPGLDEGATFSDIVTLNFEELLAAAVSGRERRLCCTEARRVPVSKSGYWLAYKRAGRGSQGVAA